MHSVPICTSFEPRWLDSVD